MLQMMPDDISPGDYFLALIHAENGNIGFIDETMSTYRVHAGGMSFGLHKGSYDLVWLKYGLCELNFYRAIEKHFNGRLRQYFQLALERKVFAVLDAFFRHGAFDNWRLSGKSMQNITSWPSIIIRN